MYPFPSSPQDYLPMSVWIDTFEKKLTELYIYYMEEKGRKY